MWELDYKESWGPKNWCYWTAVLKKTPESPLDCKEIQPVQSILKEISPGCSLEGLSWSWNSNSLATSCEELTHWKRLWCWEGLGAGGEGEDRGWDGWMASPTRWTWVWVDSGGWWWTGRPGVLQSPGSQRVGHDWATELNWTELRLPSTHFPLLLPRILILLCRTHPSYMRYKLVGPQSRCPQSLAEGRAPDVDQTKWVNRLPGRRMLNSDIQADSAITWWDCPVLYIQPWICLGSYPFLLFVTNFVWKLYVLI